MYTRTRIISNVLLITLDNQLMNDGSSSFKTINNYATYAFFKIYSVYFRSYTEAPRLTNDEAFIPAKKADDVQEENWKDEK